MTVAAVIVAAVIFTFGAALGRQPDRSRNHWHTRPPR